MYTLIIIIKIIRHNVVAQMIITRFAGDGDGDDDDDADLRLIYAS